MSSGGSEKEKNGGNFVEQVLEKRGRGQRGESQQGHLFLAVTVLCCPSCLDTYTIHKY